MMRGYEEEDRVIAVKKAKEVAAMKLEILAANDKAIADRKALREKDKEVRGGAWSLCGLDVDGC